MIFPLEIGSGTQAFSAIKNTGVKARNLYKANEKEKNENCFECVHCILQEAISYIDFYRMFENTHFIASYLNVQVYFRTILAKVYV